MFLCLSGLGLCCDFLIHCGRLLLSSGGLLSHLILWWLSTMLWWSSAPPAPPWSFPATLWWASALSDPLWWLSTILWWSTVPLWLYASLALLRSSVSARTRPNNTTQPGLPSRPCSALAPLLTCTLSWRASESCSLGRGYVTVVRLAHHQR